jgi:hypothetical protein
VRKLSSDARRLNSALSQENHGEPFALVVKADGMKSEYFPADLRTLFSYDGKLLVWEDSSREVLTDGRWDGCRLG